MPVAKHRPNFAELISQAAIQRQRLIDRQNNMFRSMKTEKTRRLSTISARPAATVHPESDENPKENEKVVVSLVILISTAIQAVLSSLPLRVTRLFAILLAFAALSMHTAARELSYGANRSLYIIDKIVDIYFIVFGVLSILSVYSNAEVRQLLQWKIDMWEIITNSCIFDVVISVMALSFGTSSAAVWCRMIRLLFISTFALRSLPHIDVLVSGITLGVRSLISTWLLLTLTFVVYSACGLTFFGTNDPEHFGTMAMSMWTFFQLATMDNWSTIMYINIYGCDSYPSNYVVMQNHTGLDFVARYGKMTLAVCTEPMKRPIIASVVFVSFLLLCGFILISLTIASVTSGINDRLSQLEKEEMVREKAFADQPANSLLTNKDMLLMLMLEVWKQDEEFKKESRKKRQRETLKRSNTFVENMFDFMKECSIMDIKKNSVIMRTVTNHYIYRYFIAFLLAFAAFVEIWVIQNPQSNVKSISSFQIVLQIIFSVDIAMKLVANYPEASKFFNDRWNTFDFWLVIGTWIPLFTRGQPGHDYFSLLRVLRILRLLRLLSWIADLNIMLRSISTSAKAMMYVILLMFLFFYNFAIIGVLLFQENDYYHFGNLFKAVLTLFQVVTLDDWSEVAKTNMYGCDYYGYDSGEDYYDARCENPTGLGWFAAWYFLIFIVFGVMVLVSLFVGIIITSMELLKEGIKEEKEVWDKVRVMQKDFNLRDTTVDNLLEIFDMIDIGENGKLTLPELKPVLELVSVTQTDQFSLFMMVDKDSSGQIDFAEFIQLIHLMGLAYNRNIKKLRRESLVPINESKAAEVLSHGFGSTGKFLTSYMAARKEGHASHYSDSENEGASDEEKTPTGFKSSTNVKRHVSVADEAALSILQGDSENMERKRSGTGSDAGIVNISGRTKEQVPSSSSQVESESHSKERNGSVVSDLSKEVLTNLMGDDPAVHMQQRGDEDSAAEEEEVVAYGAESVMRDLDSTFQSPELEVKQNQLDEEGSRECVSSTVEFTVLEKKNDALASGHSKDEKGVHTSNAMSAPGREEDLVHVFSSADVGDKTVSALRLEPLTAKSNHQVKYLEHHSVSSGDKPKKVKHKKSMSGSHHESSAIGPSVDMVQRAL